MGSGGLMVKAVYALLARAWRAPATRALALLAASLQQIAFSQLVLQAQPITNSLCTVYFIVNTVLFILSLALMILGGAIYAGSSLLPGQTRGTLQAYSWGLILGGVAGAIIGMLAPFILSTVTGNTVTQILSVCP